MKTIAKILAIAALFLGLRLAAQVPLPYATTYVNVSLSSTPVQAYAGTISLGGYNISNPNSSTIYFVQFFDAASPTSVILGTTTPKMILAVAGGFPLDNAQIPPILFSQGVVVAATTTPVGTTGPGSAFCLTLFLH
jgi:hypothetical protein